MKGLVYFYQHLLSSYNFEFFKRLKKCNKYNITFFFDKDVPKMASELKGIVGRSLKLCWKSIGRKIEVYFSCTFLYRILVTPPLIILSEDGGNVVNNLFLVLLKPILKFKVVLWGLGDIANRRPSFYKRCAWPFIRFIWVNSDAIISYSTYGKNIYKLNGVNENRIFVAPNAIELGNIEDRILKYRQSSPLKISTKDKKVILFVGRLEPTKKVEDLLMAFKILLSKSHYNICLYIIGMGSCYNKLQKIIVNENLANCNLVGEKDLYSVSEYFAFADVCVIPGEGGLVINHALAHGVPVIVSTGDGTEFDLVRDEENGVFFERGNIQQLVKAILTVLTDGNFRKRTGREAQYVPSIQNMVFQFLKAFDFVSIK